MLLCVLNRTKNGDIVKLDLNALYSRYISLVAMDRQLSFVFGNKSVFKFSKEFF